MNNLSLTYQVNILRKEGYNLNKACDKVGINLSTYKKYENRIRDSHLLRNKI